MQSSSTTPSSTDNKPAFGPTAGSATTPGGSNSNPYPSGHAPGVTSFHALRTVPNSAPHLLPLLPGLPPRAKILDVGCGPGTITKEIAKLAPQCFVTGVDYVDVFIDNSGEGFLGNLEFRLGDVMKGLPFKDAEFDLVHLHQVLQHVENPVLALKEVRRVVKKKGRDGGDGGSITNGIVTLRESAAMTWWPQLAWIERWQALYKRVTTAGGANPHPGARLHVWCMEAGWKREELMCSAGTWCFSDLPGRQQWAETMAARAAGEGSGFRKSAVDGGFTTAEELDEFAKLWREWAEREDAWWTITHGQVVCHC